MAHSISPVAILAALPMARLQAGAARLHQVMPGVEAASLVPSTRLARQVEILRVRDDGAADDLVDVLRPSGCSDRRGR